jgi:hypothetical protein
VFLGPGTAFQVRGMLFCLKIVPPIFWVFLAVFGGGGLKDPVSQ